MQQPGIQQLIFDSIKNALPSHISMVDEIAVLLGITNDSVYRRIRGQTAISLEELQILTTHYNIPLDKFFHFSTSSYIFSGKLRSDSNNTLETWLQFILIQLQMFNSHEKKHMYYFMKDIPPYTIFLVPELARFKFFFYMNSILQHKSLSGVRFVLNDPQYDKFEELRKKIVEFYLQIPATEIWNVLNIESTLRQIAFYKDAGSFKNLEEVHLLYSKIEQLVNHLELQAEQGQKFNFGQEPTSNSAENTVYVNDLVFGDNSILVELDNKRITFLNYGLVYFVYTDDERFNSNMRGNFDDLLKKSTMVTRSGEKERVRFFKQLRERINYYRDLR